MAFAIKRAGRLRVTAARMMGVTRGCMRKPSGSSRGFGTGVVGTPSKSNIPVTGRVVELPVRTLRMEERMSVEGAAVVVCPVTRPMIESMGLAGAAVVVVVSVFEIPNMLRILSMRFFSVVVVGAGVVVVVVVVVPKMIFPIPSIRLGVVVVVGAGVVVVVVVVVVVSPPPNRPKKRFMSLSMSWSAGRAREPWRTRRTCRMRSMLSRLVRSLKKTYSDVHQILLYIVFHKCSKLGFIVLLTNLISEIANEIIVIFLVKSETCVTINILLFERFLCMDPQRSYCQVMC